MKEIEEGVYGRGEESLRFDFFSFFPLTPMNSLIDKTNRKIKDCRETLERVVRGGLGWIWGEEGEEELKKAIGKGEELGVGEEKARGVWGLWGEAKVMLGMRFGVRYGGRVGGEEGGAGRGLLLDESLTSREEAKVRILGREGEEMEGGEINVQRGEMMGELERKKVELEGAMEELEKIREVLEEGEGGEVLEKGEALIKLRKGLLEGDWEGLDGCVGGVSLLGGGEGEGQKGGWGGAEVWLAKDEVRGRQRAKEVLEGLKGGVEGVKERSGEWGHPAGGVLEYWLGEGEGMGLREELEEMKEGRRILGRVREVEEVLGEGVKLGVGYGGRGEVGLFLDNVWGGVMEVKAKKIEGKGDGEDNQEEAFHVVTREEVMKILEEKNAKLGGGLEEAKELGLATRLTEVGEGILSLRKALLEGNWENVEERAKEVKLKGVGEGEGWEAIGGDEVRLAEDERRGREAVRGCLEGLRKGWGGIAEESDEWVHPAEGVLERGLGEGERLGVAGGVEEIKEAKEWLEKVRGVGKGVREGMGVGVVWGRRVEVGLLLEGEVEMAVVRGKGEEEGGEEWEVTRGEVVEGLEKGVQVLGAALEEAGVVGVVTRLVRVAKELWGLRKALLGREWREVEERLGGCLGGGVGKGGVGGGGEVRFAEDELAGRSTVGGVLEELKEAVEGVKGGMEGEWVHPSEGMLERGLGKAERLGVPAETEEVKNGREILEKMREAQRAIREGMLFGVEWGGRVGEGGEGEGGVGMILDDDLGVCGNARVLRLKRGGEEEGEEKEEGEGDQREIIEVGRKEVLEELERQGEKLKEGLEKADAIGLVTRLIVQGGVMLGLRKALESKNWEEVGKKVEEAVGVGVGGAEVWLAKDEMKGRERAREVLGGLGSAVEGVSAEKSGEWGHWAEGELERWLEEGERVGMRGDLEGVVAGRDMLEELRAVRREVERGMRWGVEYGGRLVVQVVLDRGMSCVEIVKFRKGGEGEVEIGIEELVGGLREVTETLVGGMERAAKIGLVTRLVEEGGKVLKLRNGLLEGDWGVVEGWLEAEENRGIGGGEVVLARDEVAGRGRGREVLEALRRGIEDVGRGTEEEWVHPAEGELERWLGEGEKVGLREDLEEMQSGRAVLGRLREVRGELQKGLEMVKGFAGRWGEEGGAGEGGWSSRVVELAEGYEELYELFDKATQQLKRSSEMAAQGVKGDGVGFVTKEVKEVEYVMSEVTILWYLLEDLQAGGYLEGGKPSCLPSSRISLDPITSHYSGMFFDFTVLFYNPFSNFPFIPFPTTDYSVFPYKTEVGRYVIRKMYFILTVRVAVRDMCVNPEGVSEAVRVAGEEGALGGTPEVISAALLARELDAARAALGVATDAVKEDLLIEAVKGCEALFFEDEQVQRVRELRNVVVELNEESRKAMWVLDKERMKSVVAKADGVRLETHHLDYCKYLLGLSPMDWLKFELKKAKELGDEDRKIRLSIEMKDLTLSQFSHLFGLNTLKNMRSPENYASQKLLSMDRKKLAGGMLSFSKTPAHTSLVDFAQLVNQNDPQAHKIVQGLVKDSTRTFKNIMGYMGDKKYPDTLSLVQEVVEMCLVQPMLRSEVYLQVGNFNSFL